MGTYRIMIEGHGIHHNGRTDDADTIIRRTVRELQQSGHDIHRAAFELTDGEGKAIEGSSEQTDLFKDDECALAPAVRSGQLGQ